MTADFPQVVRYARTIGDADAGVAALRVADSATRIDAFVDGAPVGTLTPLRPVLWLGPLAPGQRLELAVLRTWGEPVGTPELLTGEALTHWEVSSYETPEVLRGRDHAVLQAAELPLKVPPGTGRWVRVDPGPPPPDRDLVVRVRGRGLLITGFAGDRALGRLWTQPPPGSALKGAAATCCWSRAGCSRPPAPARGGHRRRHVRPRGHPARRPHRLPGGSPAVSRFTIGERDFLLDGDPVRVLAGALHYFRVHPDQWTDRIRKAKAMGLNTIETYVAWNAHAPSPGEFSLTGQLDLGRFLDLVAEEGMHAIVRPGPYICAEWDGGGFPAWLFQDAATGVRRSEPAYLAAVEDYLRQLAPVLVPRQVDNGGPIVLVQVENEYGAYGDDSAYLSSLVKVYRDIGLTVPYVTVDQPDDAMLPAGGLPDVLKTGSFGGRVAERLAALRRHQPTGPLMCMEFWCGWFDHWGERHHTRSAAEAAADLDALLSAGASVNIYMFHGGTNFGFTSGANDHGIYKPTATSYDYDAPLDEAGNPTEKYHAFRAVLARHGAQTGPVPDGAAPFPTLTVPFGRELPLWDAVEGLPPALVTDHPPTMDAAGQSQGFAVYRCRVPDRAATALLTLGEVRDRAQFFLDGEPVGVLSRDHGETALALPAGRRVSWPCWSRTRAG
ncbi:beta-galactosidase family protein [Actinokineospora soli]|uniref:Beta-galactosidase n=1 Tax=Actinokineospora soli TaxID=1048753 RepID=A0ABW2TMK9_9PSEU